MSGQWEVVGKNKHKQNGQASKKLTKSERKKFVENAPKVEDILPLAQVKTLYTTLENKENRKPLEKENSVKENDAKKTQKKQPEKKKKEVKEKPQIPKSLELAVKEINIQQLSKEIEIGQARFQETPLVWLKGLAEYLNVKLEHTNPVSNPKLSDYPLCVISGEIKEIIKRALRSAGETTTQHFFHICLGALASDMSKGSVPLFGYKVMLQLMAFQNPSTTIANIPKVMSTFNSFQNRQPIGLTILWAVGQGGMKDIQIGIKAWLEIMAPMLEMKNYSAFVINYLRDILTSKPESKTLNQDQYFAVLDAIYVTRSNLQNNVRQDLHALGALLRLRILTVEPEKRLQNFFEPFLTRLHLAPKALREELLTCLVLCLSKDQNSFSVWRQLYTKYIPHSAILLEHIDSHWKDIQEKIQVKVFKKTLSAFQGTNEELKKGKPKDEQHLKQCQHSCEELLKKMTVTRSFPWKLVNFLLLLTIAGLLSYDINKHGSFKSSSTGRFLNDVGALEYGEHAWATTKTYSNKSFRWAEENLPHYYKVVSEYSKPYLDLGWDICLVIGHQLCNMYENINTYVEEKTPIVIDSINHYAPGLLEKIKVHSIDAWDFIKHNGLILWQYSLDYSSMGIDWVKTNIFVGNLSPENLQKYSMEALNTTQVYAVWTYDWVCRKVQTLSKIQ